jgi:hypothetical protein
MDESDHASESGLMRDSLRREVEGLTSFGPPKRSIEPGYQR